MAFINEPEEPMSRDQAAAILKRTLNELPTIAAGAGAVLYVFGIDIGEATVADVVEQGEAVVGFAIWLLVRANIAGPVTLARRSQDEPDTATSSAWTANTPPEFVNYEEPTDG